MKPFTVETPVLTRAFYDEGDDYDATPGYDDDGMSLFICRRWLSKRFHLGRAKKISLVLSTRKSKEAVEIMFSRLGDCYATKDEYTKGLEFVDNVWLKTNTPLGQLNHLGSATIYVTLYIHEE